MSLEIAVDELTAQTTDLLDTCVTLRESTETRIADAVALSVNQTIEPLLSMATNLITTQSLLVTYITRSTT